VRPYTGAVMSEQIQPKRIQRKRTQGFNLQAASTNPNGVVYVGRPGKYGNPYGDVKHLSPELCLKFYENTAQGIWEGPLIPEDSPVRDYLTKQLYDRHTRWRRRIDGHPLEAIRRDLSGKDLACWCPLSSPCHADILLRLANAAATQGEA
jgi:hypothetical protein